jgi:hypothetical protein
MWAPGTGTTTRTIRRVFRTAIGDWAVELGLDGKAEVEIFDHHPTVDTMRALREIRLSWVAPAFWQSRGRG